MRHDGCFGYLGEKSSEAALTYGISLNPLSEYYALNKEYTFIVSGEAKHTSLLRPREK